MLERAPFNLVHVVQVMYLIFELYVVLSTVWR